MLDFDRKIKETKQQTLPIKIDEDLKCKIQDWESNNIFYGLLPVVGDSMTCNNEKSIPNGSKILISEIDINKPFNLKSEIKNPNWFLLLPTNKPLALVIRNNKGQEQCVVKEIFIVDNIQGVIGLRSYNPKHKDAFISIDFIKKVFKVHKIFID